MHSIDVPIEGWYEHRICSAVNAGARLGLQAALIGPCGRILTICLPMTIRQPRCGTDARCEGCWTDADDPRDDVPELVSGDNIILLCHFHFLYFFVIFHFFAILINSNLY